MTWIIQLTVAVACLISSCLCREVELIEEYNLLKFNEPPGYPKNPKYEPEETILTGIEAAHDRIFLAFPRIFGTGHPASFGFIPRRSTPHAFDKQSPLIEAYPSWEWHAAATADDVNNPASNCTGLVSVTRARIDACNRLWVLDTGVLDALTVYNVVCPPKILVFDLATDQVVRTINFPKSVLRPFSLFTSMVIDESTDKCDNAFLYLGDPLFPGLLVYDAKKDAAWRLSHPNMFAEPDYARFELFGESFTLMDGPVGITLSPNNEKLYFQSFASNKIYSISTSVLRGGPRGPGFPDADLPSVKLEFVKSSQAAPLATDPLDGSIVVAPCNDTGIISFPGTNDPRLLAFDPVAMQFILDIRAGPYDGDLWFVSSRLQKFFKKTLNRNEINFRIMRLTSGHLPPFPLAH
ncbi:unnamed protein product [Bemisia tabaci]|uniref:Uncharacterized protein n=1 Tax=Bemisia tabaci TaxID=7038 RepID=A0A9P0C578_BEMTA|nr:unnamed protein product [Bemisia tabaci]